MATIHTMHDMPTPKDDDQPDTPVGLRAELPYKVQAQVKRAMERNKSNDALIAKWGPLKWRWGAGPYPPWIDNDPENVAKWRVQHDRIYREEAFTPLQKTRAKLLELTDVVRTDAFNDWVSKCLVKLTDPRGWTQARVLYESYLKHARKYGSNSGQMKEAAIALVSETTWGRMMASRFPNKVRRGSGWHYPVRLKVVPGEKKVPKKKRRAEARESAP